MNNEPRKPGGFLKKRILRHTVLVFSFFLFSSRNAISDTVVLTSGKTVQGKIVERADKSIQIDVGVGFPITYYSDEIKEIIPEGPASQTKQANAVSKSGSDEADQLEQQGLGLIESGQMEEGVALLRKAIALDPKANRHLNLGTILSGNGVALFKQGDQKAAVKILKESEHEIQQAIKMFDPVGETIMLSQAYYLLGEMHAQGFKDTSAAKEYYQKSISFYNNPSAERGLKALSP